MISKFEATGGLDGRPCSGRSSRNTNAPRTVHEGMEIIAGSSTHGEVSFLEFLHSYSVFDTGIRCTGILYIAV